MAEYARRCIKGVISALVLSCFATTEQAFADPVGIHTEFVGNAGNPADTTNFGSVSYDYRIGRYEVTAGQYTAFLNAVARADPHGLYSSLMDYDANPAYIGCNIKQVGSTGTYTYTVAADWADRPVNYVSLWDAARFANWLTNGQPTGPQGPGTTEDGAYHDIDDRAKFGRNPGGRFFIPTEDEWYKAAYHKNDGATANYWDYPTQSDTAPRNILPDLGNGANFFDNFFTGNGGYTIGPPYWRTKVGEFINSASTYGTFDQGGNVWEWNEAAMSVTSHSVLGGSVTNWSNNLLAGNHYGGGDPSFESGTYGFRLAATAVIPEPSSLLLTIIGCLGVGAVVAFKRIKARLPLVDKRAGIKRICRSSFQSVNDNLEYPLILVGDLLHVGRLQAPVAAPAVDLPAVTLDELRPRCLVRGVPPESSEEGHTGARLVAGVHWGYPGVWGSLPKIIDGACPSCKEKAIPVAKPTRISFEKKALAALYFFAIRRTVWRTMQTVACCMPPWALRHRGLSIQGVTAA